MANNIKFQTITKTDLVSESDIKLWMIFNQIGKRNLTNFQKSEFAIEIEKIERIKALERMRHNTSSEKEPRSDLTYPPNENGKSLELAAKSVGLGYGTVHKTKKILEKAPLELIEKVRNGDVSIDRAFNQIQKAERLETNKVTEWPKGKYRVIYADPPWQYGFIFPKILLLYK